MIVKMKCCYLSILYDFIILCILNSVFDINLLYNYKICRLPQFDFQDKHISIFN